MDYRLALPNAPDGSTVCVHDVRLTVASGYVSGSQEDVALVADALGFGPVEEVPTTRREVKAAAAAEKADG